MIVDLHTHIWESPEQLGRGSAQRLLRHGGQPWDRPDASSSAHDAAMEPVQHAVILGFESQMLGGSIPPEQVARYVERKPGKYLGFAGIDPMAGRAAARIEAAQAMGLVGVTISPAAQGFHPSHTLAWPLYETCAERGLPLLVHGGTHLSSEAKLEFAQPVLLDEVAREFPRLKIIISQVGHPWIEETLVLLAKHRNVFADLSNVVTRPWQLYNLLHSAHQQGVMDRLLFGSDFPMCTPQKAITTIYSVNTLTQGTMLPSVPREQLRSIVERDVLEVLGLRRKEKAAAASGAATVPSVAKPVAIIAPAVVLPSVATVAAVVPVSKATAAITAEIEVEDETPPITTTGSASSVEPAKMETERSTESEAAPTYDLDESSDDAPAKAEDAAATDATDIKPENQSPGSER